ncbi:hypothetical protein ATANTOWER_007525 [Ataeniobius toweri]|uniref:Uncharacterized protein n=1 Tax=Ataeniobius toweri TaxID=208326 RepID=A0ABU7AJM9_9TELE|nr:hypothetical protein [Ataeniobius toweri]
MKRMLRVLHNVPYFIKNPSLYIDLQRFQRSPQNRTSLLYQLVELFKSLALMLLPQQMMAEEITLSNRLIEERQRLAANTEGPKPPQEVQSALSLLLDGFTVASPLQSVVQVNTLLRCFIFIRIQPQVTNYPSYGLKSGH